MVSFQLHKVLTDFKGSHKLLTTHATPSNTKLKMSQSISSPRSSEAHTLSCVSCRQRKVKCAKVYPCPHCVRGGLECIFPARKKDRAPRRNKNTELLSRLAKLEAIVVGRRQGQGHAVESTAAAVADSLAPTSTTDAATQAHRGVQVEPDPLTSAIVPPPPPRSREDPAAKYVSGEFWANLATEVEGIKTVLEQPSESEEESEDDGGGGGARAGGQSSYHSPASHVVSQAMFGNVQFANATGPLLHPRPDMIKKLRDIYFQNADMLIKILHRPTIEKEFDLFIVNPEDNLPSKSLEAVFCAVYFAAITTLSPEQCWAQLGEDRAVLVAQYRQGVEVALARADYLNNTSLECLQALTLYNVSNLVPHTHIRVLLTPPARPFSASITNPAPHGPSSLWSTASPSPTTSTATAPAPPLPPTKPSSAAASGQPWWCSTCAPPKTVERSP